MGRHLARLTVAVLLTAGLTVVMPTGPAGADGNEAPGAPEAFRSVTVGDGHSCALRQDGAVRCWGSNFVGQLGLGDPDSRGDGPGEMGDALPTVALGTGRTATSISGAAGHTCAVLDDGSVKCWGWNDNGRLGLGDSPAHRGDAAEEMGDALPLVDLGTGRTATVVTVGHGHACAFLDDHGLRCWGRNATGDLGLGDTDDRGDGPGEMGAALPPVALPPTNDAFAAAEALPGASGAVTGSSGGAGTEEPDEPDHDPSPTGAVNSIWYAWTAPAAGRTSFDTFGTGYDTVLAVYTGSALDALTPVGANDDTDGSQSRVAFTAVAGTTYRIALATPDDADPTTGATSLQWRQSAPCDGRPVTRDLTMGDTPTAGADVIRGTNGNDTINGGGGADRICGGNGNDRLTGGPGTTADRLFGDTGTDTLRGGNGNDLLSGGVGPDTLFGEAGADTLNGGPQRDTCNGGLQRDTHAGCEVRTSIP